MATRPWARLCAASLRGPHPSPGGPLQTLKRSHGIIRQQGHHVRFASTTAEAAPRPSLLRRVLAFSAMGIVFTTVGFVAAVTPSYSLWNGLLRPPTDAETITLFQPADAAAAAVEAKLQAHPLTAALRADPAFTEARPHMKIPAHLRIHHLTSGLLTGPGRLAVPPLAFFEADGRSSAMLFHVGDMLCGHPGVVHGGALATLVDEGLARCCFGALPNKLAMTARLELSFAKPVPADSYLALRARTVKVEGRKAWVEGRLESLPMDGGEPVVYVEAKGLFIEPKRAKVMSKLYPAAAAG